MGARYWPFGDFDYPVSRTDEARIGLPPASAFIAWKYAFNTTLGAEANERSGFNAQRLENLRRQGFLGRIGLGLGPSFVSTVSGSSWNASERPWLRHSRAASNVLDATITAAIPELNGHVSLSHRYSQIEDAAFGFSQRLSRRSVALEVFRNLANFHGFVPYVGVFGSYEHLSAQETEGGVQVLSRERRGPGAGILVGWDILPTQSEFLVLRTNLRYSPALALKVEEGRSIAFDQFEFNVIQVVVYPGRLSNHLKTKRTHADESASAG